MVAVAGPPAQAGQLTRHRLGDAVPGMSRMRTAITGEFGVAEVLD